MNRPDKQAHGSPTRNTTLTRRHFFHGGATAALLSLTGANIAQAQATELPDTAGETADDLAKNEAFWRAVAAHYEVTDQITNLENGYWGVMANSVLQNYQRLSAWVNKQNTYFARFDIGKTYQDLRNQVAQFLNVDTSEIALTRGATESLQALIGSYNKLSPGDSVLYADLDYSEMKNAMRWLADRRGVTPVKVTFPEPTKEQQLSEADILSFYQRTLDSNPRARLLLLTHLNNWTGLIIPVKKIAEMAKARGVDVILDAAHSVGQVDFNISELDCDYVGVNLHKWVGAPIGCGVIYIRNGYANNIDTYMGRNPGSDRTIDRIDTGTVNFAAHMAIPAAFDFHKKIGTRNKEARLRHLRDLWVSEVRHLDGITVLTPDNPDMVAGLTSFRLDGVTSTKDNNALMRRLAKDFGVLTTRRTGPDAGDCIRVTPSFYNSPDDIAKLVRGLKIILADTRS